MKKRFLILILVPIMTILLASCSVSEPEIAMKALDGWQEYTLIRSDTSGKIVTDALIQMRSTIEEKLGVKLAIGTDFAKKPEDIPVGTKEILIGSTNRPESEVDIGYLDFSIRFENNRVIITGGCDEAAAEAVEWFLENCIAETILYPIEPYIETAKYPLADVTVDGILLSEFAVDMNVKYSETEKALCQWIAVGTGNYPSSEGTHKIIAEEDTSLSMMTVSMKSESGNIVLSGWVGDYSVDMAAKCFCEAVEARTSGNVLLNGVTTVEIPQFAAASADQIAEWRSLTDARIEEIRNTPNMEIPAGRTIYYISENGDDNNDGKTPEKAWKSVAVLNTAPLKSGDYVCFERGGVYRGKFSARTGVTYTAYGEGDKPKLYGSPFNGAEYGKWEEIADNIWRYSEKIKDDVGTIVMNHGEAHAIKIITSFSGGKMFDFITKDEFLGYESLDRNLEFWHDLGGAVTQNAAGGYIYMYWDGENPADVWDSIEFNTIINIISAGAGVNGVTLDNLCVKYGGSHGIGTGTVNDLTVQNCEFGWIGGSIQHYTDGVPTRYGNCIEIYGGCDRFTVVDNYIYQAYDAGITQQTKVSEDESIPTTKVLNQKNMNYSRNVIEYCNYNIEYFLSRIPIDNPSTMDGFLISENLSWYPGEGFCEQRPNRTHGAHIRSSTGSNRAKNYVIRDNLFVGNAERIFYISSSRYHADGSDSMPELSGNNFVGIHGNRWGVTAMEKYSDIRYDLKLLDYLGEHTDGTDTFWFTESWH